MRRRYKLASNVMHQISAKAFSCRARQIQYHGREKTELRRIAAVARMLSVEALNRHHRGIIYAGRACARIYLHARRRIHRQRLPTGDKPEA